MFALGLAVVVGFAAMTIDVGLMYEERRGMQNAADAAALAGVAELPLDPIAARKRAEEWAANNGVPSSEIKTIEVRTTDALNDTLYVELGTDFGWVFGRVLGLDSSPLSASAAAQIQSMVGTSNLMPWAIVMGDSACLNAMDEPIPGEDCSVKIGASDSVVGWYGALDLDGSGGGSSEYESNVVDGAAETVYCAEGQQEPQCQSSVVDALAGNKVGGTGQGIDTRLMTEPTEGCDDNGSGIDDFGEVFVPAVSGQAQFGVGCPLSPRLIIIPIVTLNGLPVQTVTIEGWALAYLKGYMCVGVNCPTGSGHWEVQITMVDAIYAQAPGMIGAFNPLSGISVSRLIQ